MAINSQKVSLGASWTPQKGSQGLLDPSKEGQGGPNPKIGHFGQFFPGFSTKALQKSNKKNLKVVF